MIVPDLLGLFGLVQFRLQIEVRHGGCGLGYENGWRGEPRGLHGK